MRLTRDVMAGVVAVMLAPAALGEPEVFSQAGYEADRTAAIEQERLHLVYATADWCPPCKRMKTTTWVDESVETWVEQYGIVTALDVDEFPKIAQDLGVQAMPTMILFEGGEELGRTVGYQSAADLVSWMEAGRKGEALPTPAAFEPADDPGEERFAGTRFQSAADLLYSGKYDESANEFARVWPDIVANDRYREPPHGNFEVIVAYSLMHLLVREHPPAEDVFRPLRDASQKKLESGERSWETLTSWVYLSSAIGDDEALLAWARRVAGRENAAATLDRYRNVVSDVANRFHAYDVTAAMIDDPVGQLAVTFSSLRTADFLQGDVPLDEPAYLADAIRDPIVAALYKNDGGEAEREVIEYLETYAKDNPEWRALFIGIADDVGKLRDEHRAWIDEHGLREAYPDLLDGIGGG